MKQKTLILDVIPMLLFLFLKLNILILMIKRFYLIVCDGIFEKMKNKFLINSVWDVIKKFNFKDIHNLNRFCCIEIIMNFLLRKKVWII